MQLKRFSFRAKYAGMRFAAVLIREHSLQLQLRHRRRHRRVLRQHRPRDTNEVCPETDRRQESLEVNLEVP